MSISLLIWTSALIVQAFGSKALPKVYTELGALNGEWWETNGKTFAAFQSVPYAQPPLDQLRFAHPKPVQK